MQLFRVIKKERSFMGAEAGIIGAISLARNTTVLSRMQPLAAAVSEVSAPLSRASSVFKPGVDQFHKLLWPDLYLRILLNPGKKR
jgi:hypothetical protein